MSTESHSVAKDRPRGKLALSQWVASLSERADIGAADVDLAKFGLLLIQVVGLACLVSRYDLESEAFFDLFVLAAVGFVIQYFLPLAYRGVFFLLLSLLGIVTILGVVPGLWLIAIGLGLLAIVHLPVSMPIRVGLLCIVGTALALLRAGWATVPWSAAVWPILGSIFMFRMIVYVYDLKYGQAPESWAQRLSYFFMLPNVCFPLFPVIDSRAYARSWYEGERHECHQVGIEWILRGLVQLLLYRLVYLKWAIDPNDVANSADLIHYCLWLFLLYLRVSGQFHVIVGLLHLFGFNLAETHHQYYLASSFTDFWRRINIYWKDFMMKIFYYPAYFRLRKRPTLALIVATVWVFLFTWILHAYQWFWICGKYDFRWNDILFWAILCGLVIVNVLWEARVGRRRQLGNTAIQWTQVAVVAVKTAVTFSIICILWSFWSSESLAAWFSLWPAALVKPTDDQVRAMVFASAAGLLLLLMFLAWQKWIASWINLRFERRIAIVLGQLFLLNLVSISAVHSRLGETTSNLVVSARFRGLNSLDQGLRERGYYEELLAVNQFGELAALYDNRPADWVWLHQSDLIQSASFSGVRYELRPNFDSVFKHAKFRTNRWGMHDQEYTQQKPADCFRIAVLGASHAMGSGVESSESFEAVMERQLNANTNSTRGGRFEVLNFAVGGYFPYEQLPILVARVLPFDPDAVFYVGHPGEAKRVVVGLTQAVQRRVDTNNPFLADVIRRAGVHERMPERLIHQRLEPFAEEVLSRVYREFAATCDKSNVSPVFVRLPLLDEQPHSDGETPPEELARDAGFTVIDLDGVYDGPELRSLWIAEWDTHPNAIGHKMVGERLYQLVCESDILVGPASDR